QVAQQQWGEGGALAALYVDNHAKEVWSSLFTRAGKVSHRSRVMPCITTTYVHTGAGTPVWVVLQSGSAPLSPRLGEIVEAAEAALDDEIKRVTVIDAEGSTFDTLASFTAKERVIVTPLRPSQAESLELRYSQGSYFRPFREHDALRVAQATLHHKSTGRRLELGAAIVRRHGRDHETVLLTNGPQFDVPLRSVAVAYFNRWPVQENAFKNGAAAVKLDHHRGNCGEMVSNVAVVSELERLEGQILTAEERLGQLTSARPALEQAAESARSEAAAAEAEQFERRRHVDELRSGDEGVDGALASTAVALVEAMDRSEQRRSSLRKIVEKLDLHDRRREDLLSKIEVLIDRVRTLEPMDRIRQLDVALDSVLTSFKLTASLLILFVLREYLRGRPMTPETFVSRVLSIRGRREVGALEELIVFYENPRDGEMNDALRQACIELNSRYLMRRDRLLRYRLEEAPKKSRPLPVHLK
ncbi:MAG: hypothetical protein GY719_32975, partial [bacterium]|nr:hypothetical protein [bacterium]